MAVFVCSIVDQQLLALRWFLDNEYFASYFYNPNHVYPLNVIQVDVEGVNIVIEEVTYNTNNPDLISITSTLEIKF